MSDDLITPENVSKDLLKSIFDAALLDVSFDSDGDILVKEKCKCFVMPNAEQKRIRVMTFFGFKASASDAAKYACINDINSNYVMVRAALQNKTRLAFTYDLSLEGGVTKKAVVAMVKRFCSIPHAAVSDYGKEIVE